MTVHSLKRKWFLSKVLGLRKTPLTDAPASQQDEPLEQRNTDSTYTIQMVRDRQQLYFLERRCPF